MLDGYLKVLVVNEIEVIKVIAVEYAAVKFEDPASHSTSLALKFSGLEDSVVYY
jgi:hypothetical protein